MLEQFVELTKSHTIEILEFMKNFPHRFETIEVNANLRFHGVGKEILTNATLSEALYAVEAISIPHNVVGSRFRRIFTPYGAFLKEEYAQNGHRGSLWSFHPEGETSAAIEAAKAAKVQAEQDRFAAFVSAALAPKTNIRLSGGGSSYYGLSPAEFQAAAPKLWEEGYRYVAEEEFGMTVVFKSKYDSYPKYLFR